jgi:hypothetical protein
MRVAQQIGLSAVVSRVIMPPEVPRMPLTGPNLRAPPMQDRTPELPSPPADLLQGSDRRQSRGRTLGRAIGAGVVAALAAAGLLYFLVWARGPGADERFADALVTGDYGQAGLLLWLNPDLADTPSERFHGRSPLFWAAWEGASRQTEFLLDHGAATACGDVDGLTPLHAAAMNGNADVALLLVQRGADPHAPDARGRTPITLASQSGHADIVRLLARHGSTESSR